MRMHSNARLRTTNAWGSTQDAAWERPYGQAVDCAQALWSGALIPEQQMTKDHMTVCIIKQGITVSIPSRTHCPKLQNPPTPEVGGF